MKNGRLPPAIEAEDQEKAVAHDLYERVRPLIPDIPECNLTLLHWAETGGATPAYLQELQNYINPAWPRPASYRTIPFGWAFSTVAGAAPQDRAPAGTVGRAHQVPVTPAGKDPMAIYLRNTREVAALAIIPRLKAIAAAAGVAEAEVTRAALYIGLAALEKEPGLLWRANGIVANGMR